MAHLISLALAGTDAILPSQQQGISLLLFSACFGQRTLDAALDLRN